METAPYATEMMQGHPSEANEIKITACGECIHSVLGTKDFKASLPVIQFLFYVSWKMEGLYLPHVLSQMQTGGKKKVSCADKDFHGSPVKAALFATGLHLALHVLPWEGFLYSA